MSVVSDLEAELAAGTIVSPALSQAVDALSAVAKMQSAAAGGSPATLTENESAAIPLIAQHAGGNGDSVASYAAAFLDSFQGGGAPTAGNDVGWGLSHAAASLTALLLGGAAAFGVS